jgi:hypothetical protein
MGKATGVGAMENVDSIGKFRGVTTLIATIKD